MNKHVVYMLRCKDRTLYTGYTNNLEARLEKHRDGKGAKYTRGRGPLVLEAFQSYKTKSEALQEEYRLKQMTRERKERWISKWKKGGNQEDENSKEL